MHKKFGLVSLKGRDHFLNPKTQVGGENCSGSQVSVFLGRYGFDSSGSGLEFVAGSCEQANEPLGIVKDGKFISEKNFAPWSQKDSAVYS